MSDKMTARKLSDVEVDAEVTAIELDTWFRRASPAEREGPMPVEAMRATAELRRLSLRIARVEKDLATERRLHRDTEKRAQAFKVERDVARRERDELGFRKVADLTYSLDLPSEFTLANIPCGPDGRPF